MSERFERCQAGDRGSAWTCVLSAGHDDGHIYSLWSEIAAMAEAEIRLAEAAFEQARELHYPFMWNGQQGCHECSHRKQLFTVSYPCATIRALYGGAPND